MRLPMGERYTIKEQDSLLLVKRGKVELYAATIDRQHYRQMYLLECCPDAAVFPALDEFEHIEFFAYAVEDTELAEISWTDIPAEELRQRMQGWLSKLADLPWVRHLADMGDDMLQPWGAGTVFQQTADAAIVETFRENASVFSMLAGVRFQSEDKKWQSRVTLRERQKKRLVDEGIGLLLGEQVIRCEEESTDDLLNEAVFLVKKAAHSLGMPVDAIHLPPEVVKRLSPDRLLHRLIQKANMQIRQITLEAGWHHLDSGVIMGYYEEELAVCIQDRPGVYRLYTMRHPEGELLDDAAESKLSRQAYTCYAGLPKRRMSVRDVMAFMFRQCWKKDYATIILASLAAGILPLLTPIVTETIFQDVIPIQDRLGLATITQVMLVAAFSMAAIGMVRTVAVLRITTHLDIATEAALWNRLLSLPARFFRQFTAGELASRMDAVNVIKGVVSGNFVAAVFNTVFSFWSLFLMCCYSLTLTGVAVGIWLVYCVVIAFVYRRVLGFQRESIRAGNTYAGLVQQIFTGLAKFRIHGAEAQAYHLWSQSFGECWKWKLKMRWQGNYNTIITSIEPFILSLALYYVALYGITTVQPDGSVTTGLTYPEFLAFSAAYGSFNGALHSLIPLVGTFFTIQPHLENLRPILDEVPEDEEDKADAGVLSGAVGVSHLSFSYEKGGPEILHDVSFTIKPGETVAIVGRSGCGKSTLVRLLLGFETPNKGTICYDGQDLASLSLPSVRSQMGIVLQNGQLMAGDIFTNIIGTSSLTMEDAWAAAEAAGIAQDIADMPMGMQTVVSEGSGNISGGQRQRLLIARALAGNPGFILLDEATSALDNRTQAIVTSSLMKCKATRVVVAHRLSTIRDADHILVMDQGTIVETGRFETLLAKGGLFAALVKRQLV